MNSKIRYTLPLSIGLDVGCVDCYGMKRALSGVSQEGEEATN